jgi:predicted GIY-YIG superfamily endonuclease
MKYVYEIVNTLGTVEYVGQTNNPKRRLREHIKCKPLQSGYGKFYGRQDVVMNIVTIVETLKEARDLEEQLQLEYGLVTDRSKKIDAFKFGVNSYWASLSTEQKTEVATRSANNRWEKLNSIERFDIIKKGHITRKNNKLINHAGI